MEAKEILRNKRYRRFVKGSGKRATDEAVYVRNSITWTDYSDLLRRCADLYEKGREWRDNMRRWTDYTLGNQWGDYINDPDSMYEQKIKEEDYIKRQGFTPLKYNIMGKTRTTACGLFANQMIAPTVGVRGSGEKNRKIADMVTCALRSAGQNNKEAQMLTHELEEAWMKAIFLMSVCYKWNCEKKMKDIYVQHEDPYKLIVENDLMDKELRDVSLIGMIRDLPFREMAAQFCHSAAEVQMLMDEYTAINMQQAAPNYSFSGDRYSGDAESFYVSTSTDKCRVFEIWTKESEEALFVHDWAKGVDEFRPLSDREAIIEENARRIAQVMMSGGTEEDAQLITPAEEGSDDGYKVREFWYVRWITPMGHCIYEGETPYTHGSHPFVFGAFPMVDGKILSPAESMIDIQRGLNRMMSQMDFIRQRGAKNVLMVDANAIPDGIDWRSFADEYSRNGSVLFLKMKPGMQWPQQLKSAKVEDADIAMVNLYKQFADEISGMNGAIRGESVKADTPASLYAQQAANSANNIAYFMLWFNGCVSDLHWKEMMLIQQYYEEGRYLPVAGHEFEEEAKIFRQSDARSVMLYLETIDQNSVSMFLAQFENTLSLALQSQGIDYMTYLRSTRAPFAWKLADEIESRQQKMAQMQQGIA